MRQLPTRFLAVFLALLSLNVMAAPTLQALLDEPSLTPEKFARHFSGFRFELRDSLQEPDLFLKRECGDCDDFASLAALVLARHGYTTRVVVVMMAEQTHVVCFVKEANGFLDFNHRADPQPLVASDGSLADIARRTAAYFRSDWLTASEIRFEQGRPVFVSNAFAPAESTIDSAPAKLAEIKPVSPVGPVVETREARDAARAIAH